MQLKTLRINVWDDNLLDRKIASEIRTQLFTFEQKFKRLLSKNDKQHLQTTLAILNKSVEEISKDELCRELDYFIARFERREIE